MMWEALLPGQSQLAGRKSQMTNIVGFIGRAKSERASIEKLRRPGCMSDDDVVCRLFELYRQKYHISGVGHMVHFLQLAQAAAKSGYPKLAVHDTCDYFPLHAGDHFTLCISQMREGVWSWRLLNSIRHADNRSFLTIINSLRKITDRDNCPPCVVEPCRAQQTNDCWFHVVENWLRNEKIDVLLSRGEACDELQDDQEKYSGILWKQAGQAALKQQKRKKKRGW